MKDAIPPLESLEPLDSMAKEIFTLQNKILGTGLDDFKAYCVAKHEACLTILVEMEDFLERNIGIFLDGIGVWDKLNNGNLFNISNKLRKAFSARDEHVAIWFHRGLYFKYSMRTKKVTYISTREDNGRMDASCDHISYYFIPNSETDEGLSSLLKAPTFETYFSNIKFNPYDLDRALTLKENVDYDYELASRTRKNLIAAVRNLLVVEKSHLDGIVKLNHLVANAA